MKGSIINQGEDYYTNLSKVFIALGNIQGNYNWLITDCECYPKDMEVKKLLTKDYIWISGENLTKIVRNDNFQWIWGDLSGFKQEIPLEDVLKSKLPKAEGYNGFWDNPVTLQHNLAELEIVCWDSSLTIVISKDEAKLEKVKDVFPLSQDLSKFNMK